MVNEDGKATVKFGEGCDTIAVIGSGDFGRALAGRMVKAGRYNVVLGSRDSEKKRHEKIIPIFPKEFDSLRDVLLENGEMSLKCSISMKILLVHTAHVYSGDWCR